MDKVWKKYLNLRRWIFIYIYIVKKLKIGLVLGFITIMPLLDGDLKKKSRERERHTVQIVIVTEKKAKKWTKGEPLDLKSKEVFVC